MNKNYSKKSFTEIDGWLKDLRQNSNPDVKIFLVGNKVDLEDKRVVTTEEAKKFYEDLEMEYFIESSAKTGLNVENIFVEAAKLLYKEYQKLKNIEMEHTKKESYKVLDEKKKDKNKIKGCC